MAIWVIALAVGIIRHDSTAIFGGWGLAAAIAFFGVFLSLRGMWANGYRLADVL